MAEKRADIVLEGGGVKGIGLVGALSVIESEGYSWGNIAGTSAGAIVASLLAAGYTAAELETVISGVDYNRFKDEGAVDKIPFFGPLISVLAEKGVYEGKYLEDWIGGLLAAKGKRTFGDLIIEGEKDPRYRYKLNVITSDISNGLLVVLPHGLKEYGIDPDTFSIAQAVRMSMSIPFFFEPVKLKDVFFVDGGMLSNFPIWLFDSKGKPGWPTFGLKLIEPEFGKPQPIDNAIDFTKALVTTMMDAHDKMHVENSDFERTVPIPTLGVQTTEFDLSPARRDALYQSGVDAAKEFFKTWDFSAHKRKRAKRGRDYDRKIEKLKKEMVS